MSTAGELVRWAIEDSAATGVFTNIAKTRSDGISINGEVVDVTNKDSNGMREALSGAGITSVSGSFSGELLSGVTDADTARIISASINNTVESLKLTTVAGTFAGNFLITSFSVTGEHNGSQTFDATLESAGVVTFTAA